MSGPPICTRCNKPIYDGTVFKINGRCWHNACLRCVVCNNNVKQYCHLKENELFCRNDFTRLFGTKCASCFEVIPPVEAGCVSSGHVYHPTCMRCVVCHHDIKPGACFYMREDYKLVCHTDYHRLQNTQGVRQSDSESDESGSDETFEHQPACFSYDQLRMLEDLYGLRKRPSRDERAELCQNTGLTSRQVQIWFKVRRSKDKQDSAKMRTSKVINNGDIYSNNPWTSKADPTCTLQASINSYDLYCPLDFMDPDSMPPNIELCPDDICNGEVLIGKHNVRNGMKDLGRDITSAHYVTNDIMTNWLTTV